MKLSGPEVVKAVCEEVLERGGSVVPEPVVKGWLAERGLKVPRGGVAGSAAEAVRLSSSLGFPLVLKNVSEKILHKTESGGVRTGISSVNELRAAFRELKEAAAGTGERFKGVLVEEQVPPGPELIAGLQNDPHFGPVLMVGTGGVYTDLLEDVSFRTLPVKRRDVLEMIDGLKGRILLEGFRGAPAAEMESLLDTVMGLARFGEEVAPFLSSADFNPVIALPEGARVVDAKMVPAPVERRDPLAAARPCTADLDGFFNPESVAVIGASAGKGKIGNVIVDSLVNHDFTGRVYPVNPGRRRIHGVKCYPSLESLPETPRLAIMVIDLEDGPALMRELAAAGVRNLLVVSGGGKELGGARFEIEEEMTRLSVELGMRVIGPNCIGAFDGRSRFDTFFHTHERLLRPPSGPMSFITQSGTWGCGFLEAAETVGVAKMVSYGNRVDVDEGDLIEHLADDTDTTVIGSYVEGLSEGRKFLAAARGAAGRGKPVVVYKTGRNDRSALAAVSHTGAYGGTYRVYEGVFRQAGVITVDSFRELVGACKALALQPPARGPRAAMLSNGAGPMVNALDLFPRHGLELVRLGRRSVRSMRDRFSFFYIVENPVDVTGSASAEDYEFVVETLQSDPGVDVIMPFFVFQDTPLDESIAGRMKRLVRNGAKPVVGCAVGGPYTARMSKRLEAAGVPMTDDVTQWVAAARALVDWGGSTRRRRLAGLSSECKTKR